MPPRRMRGPRVTADQYLADLTTWADHVVEGVCPLIQAETFEAAAARRWHAGTHLLEDDRPALQRLGYVLVLDALVASPNVVGQALQELRRALVQYDPALALMQ
jgi:hypothetical protein